MADTEDYVLLKEAADNALNQWVAHGRDLIDAFLAGRWQPEAADLPSLPSRTEEAAL